ncbi:hypothetical protein G3N56_07465 [Desulfovibrio sulfodismutans]|uniref:Uncharacterized protein n=1 Tax=Desulfolutivibrio sulfodismutans TaxID=63561 RepID=A0A7K3NK75_9BACT|nr:hypothetical protein [Desulfolutivibrio sulfodismutans]NDY56580.1 hypothetical protein [Desulfolutivibrio sulfodismutans]QLA13038.1 hypothetical protein GD606_12565 [Desulfolutivibrio sulfodismutans DSM 3696]
MDPFTLWEKAPLGGWQSAMTYARMEDARAALDAWADDFLAEYGLLPVCGRDFRLTEDHAPDIRLEPRAGGPQQISGFPAVMPPPTRRMTLPA